MNKKSLVAAIGVLSVVLAASVYAQTTSSPAVTTAQTPDKTQDAGQFSAHKQKLLDNIGDHIARMQKKQSCIQAAVDEKALNACRSVENEAGHAGDEKKTAAPATPAKQ